MPRIYNDEPLVRTIGRNVSRTIHQSIANNLGFVGNLGDMLLNFIQQHADPENNLGREGRFPLPNSSDIEGLFGLTTGKFLPQDFISGPRNASERVLDFVGSNVPSMAKGTFSGLGSALKGLAKPVASGSVMEGIQGKGGGVGSQLIGGLGTDILFDLLTKGKLGIGNIKKYGERQQEKYAKSAKGRIPNKNVEKASEFRDKIEKMYDEVSKRSVQETKIIKPELEKLSKDLAHGKLSVEDAWTKKTSFQTQAYDKRNLTQYERNQYKVLSGMMEDFIQEKGGKYPGFITDYEKTKDITKGIRHQSPIQKVLERTYGMEEAGKTKLSKFVSPILLAAGSVATGYGKKGLGALATGWGVYKGTQYYDMLKNSKVLRGYVNGLIKAQVAGSVKQSGKLLLKINDYIKDKPLSNIPDGYLD